MHSALSSRHASHPLDEAITLEPSPESQEEFEHELVKRAMYRAVGEASPVIVVLLVLLVFSLIN